ncbi:MAG TPA: VOC family protein [Acidimicrobiia bacterium]|jgi:catechol 2,3-dioxygenase-like lactoylglutathione lyase family enzyme
MLGESPFWAMIPVADMDRAKAFYRDVLGMSPVKATDQWVSYRSGPSVFQLYPTQSAGTASHTLGGWVVDDLAATMAELRGRGLSFEEYDFPGLHTEGGIAQIGSDERAAWFHDSEGNLLAIGEYAVDAAPGAE